MLLDKCMMGGFCTEGWVGEADKPMAAEKVAGAHTVRARLFLPEMLIANFPEHKVTAIVGLARAV